MSSAAYPSESDLKSLAGEVKKRFQTAIREGDAFFYPSERISLQESEQTGILWQIRTVPALLKKPKAKDSADERDQHKKEASQEESASKPKQNQNDVFAPPYVPNLLVKELSDHVVLLNKFCVVPQHFLMVTREFESQDLPPSPRTLTLAYKIVSSHRSNSTELLGFYNCGQVSGASQPHRHLQFVQCPPLDTSNNDEDDETNRISAEDQEKILESEFKIPIEHLLERLERDGKEHDAIHALPVPWQHFVALLEPTPAIKKKDEELERYIANKFMGLLDAMFRARMFGGDTSPESSASAKNGNPRPSFNILITKRAMHVIPRSREEFPDLPRPQGDKEGKVGNLSINSLGYAGFMLTRSLEEQQQLVNLEGGVEKVLEYTGVKPIEDVTVQAGLPTTNL